jgi:hypothetical protein
MNNTVFIPKYLFEPNIKKWIIVNLNGNNWMLDKCWMSFVIDIKYVSENIIVVIWREVGEDERNIISIYKGILL